MITFTLNLNSLFAYSIDLVLSLHVGGCRISTMLLYIRICCMVLDEIYANTYVTHMDKLVKIDNKILRILLNQSTRTPVLQASLYEKFDLLPIDKLYLF